jgi:hypothetical protein
MRVSPKRSLSIRGQGAQEIPRCVDGSSIVAKSCPAGRTYKRNKKVMVRRSVVAP